MTGSPGYHPSDIREEISTWLSSLLCKIQLYQLWAGVDRRDRGCRRELREESWHCGPQAMAVLQPPSDPSHLIFCSAGCCFSLIFPQFPSPSAICLCQLCRPQKFNTAAQLPSSTGSGELETATPLASYPERLRLPVCWEEMHHPMSYDSRGELLELFHLYPTFPPKSFIRPRVHRYINRHKNDCW